MELRMKFTEQSPIASGKQVALSRIVSQLFRVRGTMTKSSVCVGQAPQRGVVADGQLSIVAV